MFDTTNFKCKNYKELYTKNINNWSTNNLNLSLELSKTHLTISSTIRHSNIGPQINLILNILISILSKTQTTRSPDSIRCRAKPFLKLRLGTNNCVITNMVPRFQLSRDLLIHRIQLIMVTKLKIPILFIK